MGFKVKYNHFYFIFQNSERIFHIIVKMSFVLILLSAKNEISEKKKYQTKDLVDITL